MGEASAVAFAEVLNKLHPWIINIVSLTLFPEAPLYQDVLNGTYEEEPEVERLLEMRTLISRLAIKTNILANHVSNPVPLTGALPNDQAVILRELDRAIEHLPESELRGYREGVRGL